MRAVAEAGLAVADEPVVVTVVVVALQTNLTPLLHAPSVPPANIVGAVYRVVQFESK